MIKSRRKSGFFACIAFLYCRLFFILLAYYTYLEGIYMKKLIRGLFFSALCFTGCTSVTETIYLQDIKVAGPVNHPPLHITSGQKAGDVTISPRLSVNSANSIAGQIDGHTPVNARGIYQVDTIFNNDNTYFYVPSSANQYEDEGENLRWDMPDVSFGMDIDFALSEKIALSGGLNYAVYNQRDLYGGSVGLGFLSEKELYGFRLDAGISWQQMSYNAATVVVTEIRNGSSEKIYVNFYRDRDKSSSITFFGSVTYNTKLTDFPVNFFVNAGYFGQSLFDFEPERADGEYNFFNTTVVDARGEGTAAFLTITPGLYQDIADFGRIIFGVRMLKETQLESPDNSFFIVPVIQVDLRL
jgi:hypothetical protein